MNAALPPAEGCLLYMYGEFLMHGHCHWYNTRIDSPRELIPPHVCPVYATYATMHTHVRPGEYISVASQKDTEEADIAKERAEQAKGPEAQMREQEELAQIYVSVRTTPLLRTRKMGGRSAAGRIAVKGCVTHLHGVQMSHTLPHAHKCSAREGCDREQVWSARRM